jgi:hypothetical protein
LGDLLAKQINVLPTKANSLPYGGTFLNRENSFNFVLGSLSLKNVINVGFQGVKPILS